MGLKRETLTNLGITDQDQLDKIMAAYGAEVEANKKANAEAIAAAVEEAKAAGVAELEKAKADSAAALEAAANGNTEEIARMQKELDTANGSLIGQKREFKAIEAIKAAGAIDAPIILSLLKLDEMENDENGEPKELAEKIEALKADKSFLFEATGPNKQPTGQGNPPADDGNAGTFAAALGL